MRKEILKQAAFELLASSTIKRYITKSIELADTLTNYDEFIASDAIDRAWFLWNQVVDSELRIPAEFELAITLVMLRQLPLAKPLLSTIALDSRSVTVWLSALARKLLEEPTIKR